MTTIKLIDHSERIKEVAEAISNILDLSVTIADSDLIRIAGTGIYRKSINKKLPDTSLFAAVARSGESFFISQTGVDELCRGCPYRNSCVERAGACTPIIFNDSVVGVIGIFAETDEKQNELLQKADAVQKFLHNMAMLISHDIYSNILFTELEKEKKRLETTLHATSDGIIMIDRNGIIIEFNKKILEYFHETIIRKNDRIQDVLQIKNNIIEDFFSEKVKQINLTYSKGRKYRQFICFSDPIKYNQKIENVVLTVTPFNQIHRAVHLIVQGEDSFTLSMIRGNSPAISELKDLITRVAPTDSTILITGESGTGKELCSRVIHSESNRRNEVFLAVNCADIPETLVESELFGYEEGAFSGAKKGGKPGKFELANKGTIFLDEISEIPIHIQTKLLRVIQEKEVTRVGGTLPYKIDVRIIAASNKDLKQLVEKGRFRQDLFFRIFVIPIHLPPLREHPEDIPNLVNHLLTRFNNLLGKHISTIEPEALDLLKAYDWPGNVRELENVIEFGVSFSEGDILTHSVISERLAMITNGSFYQKNKEKIIQTDDSSESLTESLTEVEKYERSLISNYMNDLGTSLESKREIAKKLGISQATLYRKLKKYSLT